MLELYAICFALVGLVATATMIADTAVDLAHARRAETARPDDADGIDAADLARHAVGIECLRLLKHALIIFALAYAAAAGAPAVLTSALMALSILTTATSLWGLSFRWGLRTRLRRRGST